MSPDSSAAALRRLTRIRKLVFASGGCNGAAYVGCLEAVEATLGANYGAAAVTDFYERLDECAGTSAGAFMAFAVCGGWRARPLRALLAGLDTSRIVHRMDPSRLFHEYGLQDGTGPLRMLLQELLQRVHLSPYTTFAEFHRHCDGRTLTVYATRVRDGAAVAFNHVSTPGVFVIDAILASASVPFAFTPANVEDVLYVDGALSNPYPLEPFDPDTTMGFCVSEAPVDGEGATDTFLGYAMHMAGLVGRHVDRLRHQTLSGPQAAVTFRVHIPSGMKWFDLSNFDAARRASVGRRATLALYEPACVLCVLALAVLGDRYAPPESAPEDIFDDGLA